MELACSSCGFRYKSEKVEASCPYCGKKGSVTKSATAEEIIGEFDE